MNYIILDYRSLFMCLKLNFYFYMLQGFFFKIKIPLDKNLGLTLQSIFRGFQAFAGLNI